MNLTSYANRGESMTIKSSGCIAVCRFVIVLC